MRSDYVFASVFGLVVAMLAIAVVREPALLATASIVAVILVGDAVLGRLRKGAALKVHPQMLSAGQVALVGSALLPPFVMALIPSIPMLIATLIAWIICWSVLRIQFQPKLG